MGFLDDIISDDAAAFSDDFGETVIYKPLGGVPRPIQAIVDHNPVPTRFEMSKNVTPKVIIDVENNCLTGISSAELNTGGDKVWVAVRPGAPAQDLSIHLSPDRPMDRGRIILSLH